MPEGRISSVQVLEVLCEKLWRALLDSISEMPLTTPWTDQCRCRKNLDPRQGQSPYRTPHDCPHCGRYPLHSTPVIEGLGIMLVAAEQLIATISGQRDRYRLPGELADQVGGNLRRIRKRLVINVCELWNNRQRVSSGYHEFRVLGAKMGRDATSERRLIIFLLCEADRESADGSSTCMLHERNDQRGIDPTG